MITSVTKFQIEIMKYTTNVSGKVDSNTAKALNQFLNNTCSKYSKPQFDTFEISGNKCNNGNVITLDSGYHNISINVHNASYVYAVIKRLPSGKEMNLTRKFMEKAYDYYIDSYFLIPGKYQVYIRASNLPKGGVTSATYMIEVDVNGFSSNGEGLLKEIECPEWETFNGQSYYVRDANGNLIGIRCQDQHDGGVTIGFGSYTKWTDTADVNILNQKYGIISNMTASQLFNIIIPINDCIQMMKDEIRANEADLNDFLYANNIHLQQWEYDALIIHRYLVYRLNTDTQNLLKSGNRDIVAWRNVLQEDENGNHIWDGRIEDELELFFNKDYTKNH